MAWAAIVVGVVSTGVSMYNAKKNRDAAEELSEEALEAQRIQQEKLDKQAEEYKALTFENPYENMENAYEDLTVNQQQAQFQAQQGAQQRANVLGQLRGAAGGAGIAGLAQVLANQGALQAQKISASIGLQEAQNRQLRAKGAAAADMAERGGEFTLQQAEMDRQATLLGMQQGMAAGANRALQQSYSNQMMGDLYGTAQRNQDWMNMFTQMKDFDMFSGGAPAGTTVSDLGTGMGEQSHAPGTQGNSYYP